MPVTVWDDGYVSKYKKGINLRRNGYNLTMTESYKDLINYFNKDIKSPSFLLSDKVCSKSYTAKVIKCNLFLKNQATRPFRYDLNQIP